MPLLRSVFLMAIFVAFPASNALAHKGHAGPVVTIVKKSKALKNMVPEGAKVFRRKEMAGDETLDNAERQYGIELDQDLYTYYLFRQRSDGKILGGAMVHKVPYRHGDFEIVVSVDNQGVIRSAALSSINKKYVGAFERLHRHGQLEKYAGLSLSELSSQLPNEDTVPGPAGQLDAAVYESAVLLTVLLQDAQ